MILSDQEKIELLFKALVGMIGTDNLQELTAMEIIIRACEVPNHDKMVTINAINAIQAIKGCI